MKPNIKALLDGPESELRDEVQELVSDHSKIEKALVMRDSQLTRASQEYQAAVIDVVNLRNEATGLKTALSIEHAKLDVVARDSRDRLWALVIAIVAYTVIVATWL